MGVVFGLCGGCGYIIKVSLFNCVWDFGMSMCVLSRPPSGIVTTPNMFLVCSLPLLCILFDNNNLLL